jgi:hypothetical protein
VNLQELAQVLVTVCQPFGLADKADMSSDQRGDDLVRGGAKVSFDKEIIQEGDARGAKPT